MSDRDDPRLLSLSGEGFASCGLLLPTAAPDSTPKRRATAHHGDPCQPRPTDDVETANNSCAADQSTEEESKKRVGEPLSEESAATKLTKNELLDLKWNDMFERLCRYRDKFGDCLVPRSYAADKALGHWCGNQRMLHKRRTLPDDRVQRLQGVGFSFVADERYVWSGERNKKHLDDHWLCMYRALVEFREHHGHAVVPKGHIAVTGRGSDGDTVQLPLGRWVCRQRTALSQGTLPAERKDQLDAVGFVWKPNAVSKAMGCPKTRSRGVVAAVETASRRSERESTSLSPRRKRKRDGLNILADLSSQQAKQVPATDENQPASSSVLAESNAT